MAEDGQQTMARGPQALGVRLGGRECPQAFGLLVGPLLLFLHPIFFIYSKIIHSKVLGHLELCRIGLSDFLLFGPEFQLPIFSLFI